MKIRQIIAFSFIILALVLGVIFFGRIAFPEGLEAYFKSEYYNQFGPMAICVELLVAGIYLAIPHAKANFTLAVFAFTALLDPFFNLIGLFTSSVPLYAMLLFIVCALVSLWIAFSNAFGLGRISVIGALMGFILGNAIELFFNYF